MPIGTTGALVMAASRAAPVFPRSTGSKNALAARDGRLREKGDDLTRTERGGGALEGLGAAGTPVDPDPAEGRREGAEDGYVEDLLLRRGPGRSGRSAASS